MPSKSQPQTGRCTYRSPSGRRCRSLIASGHDSLCWLHARRDEHAEEHEPRTPEAKALVSRILGSRKHFRTATDVNDALGKLFSLRARNLISASDAHLLTYMSQLMLFSLQEVKSEFIDVHDFGGWRQLLHRAVNESDPALQPVIPTSAARKNLSSKRSPKRPHKTPQTGREFAEQVFARIGIDPQTQEQIARAIAQHESSNEVSPGEESDDQENAAEYAPAE